MPVSLAYANCRHLPQRAQVFMVWMSALTAPRLRPHGVERTPKGRARAGYQT